MSLFKRLTRIAKANVEDLMRQFDSGEEDIFADKVSELERAFRDAKAAAANYSISVRKLEEEREQVQEALDLLDEEAFKALNEGAEEAARAKMADKIGLEDRLHKLSPAIDESRQTYGELKENLRELQFKLDQARAKQVELEARRQAAEARRTADEVLDSVKERHSTLDREAEEVLDKEIEQEAQRQVKELGEKNFDDLEKTARDLQIDARLEELRKRMGPQD